MLIRVITTVPNTLRSPLSNSKYKNDAPTRGQLSSSWDVKRYRRPNVSQQNAVNKIVINALDELLTIDDTRTISLFQISLVVVVIHLAVCIIIEALPI